VRRVYALIASLPFSGAQTAHFSFDMTLEAFLEGHVRVFDWLGGAQALPGDAVIYGRRGSSGAHTADRGQERVAADDRLE
jgi:hypothetical protein